MDVTFGTRLRLQRERQHVTLTAIADETKISVALLEALERDNVSRWPAGVFRRAYIRAYAQAVGLEPDTVLREFLALYPDPIEQNAAAQAIAQSAQGISGSGPSTRIGFLIRTAVAAVSNRFQREVATLTAPQTPTADVNSDPKVRLLVGVARLLERPSRFPSPERVSVLKVIVSGLEQGFRRLRLVLVGLRRWTSVLSLWVIQIGLDIWNRPNRDALASVDLQPLDAVADLSPTTRAERSLANPQPRQPERNLSTIAPAEPTQVEAKPAIVGKARRSPRAPRPARLRKASSADMPTSGLRENRNIEDALVSVARLCAALACAQGSDDIRTVLADAARILDARGVILWVWDFRRAALVPVLAHGYSEDLLALLPPVGRNTDNAIATAFRSAQTCTVEGMGVKTGAFVTPLLMPKGCGGVLALEFDNGGEKRGAIQAVARTLSAQISTLIGSQPLIHAVSA
jgi:transcriptional regulator with XRE-family HTH domain